MRKKLVLLYVILFFAVLLAPIVCQILGQQEFGKLAGIADPGSPPSFSVKYALNGGFQSLFDSWFSRAHGLNAIMIRLKNTIAYTFFNTGNGDVVVGKNHDLFEEKYIEEYCGLSSEWMAVPEDIYSLVSEIKGIQEYVISKGKAFVFLITPSKADFRAYDIPDKYYVQAEENEYHQRAYDLFVKELERQGVNFIDSKQLLSQTNESETYFVNTGIHWTKAAAIKVCNSVFSRLRNQNYSVPSLKVKERWHTSVADDIEDIDLWNLLNLLYKTKSNSFEAIRMEAISDGNSNLSIYMQGGSFLVKFARIFQECGLFSSKKMLFYDSIHYEFKNDSEITTYFQGYDKLSEKEAQELFNEITSSDIILLETNQQYCAKSGAGFYGFFLNCVEKNW